MFNLKKYFTDELLQVVLILSLLRIDRRSFEYDVPVIGISTNNLTSTWDQSDTLVHREGRIHPKSVDTLLVNYEQEVFEELIALGRYNTIFDTLTPRNLTTYLLSVDDLQTVVDQVEEAASVSADTTNNLDTSHKKDTSSEQLSQEDLDLIEILWKYDANFESSEFLEDVSEIKNFRGCESPPDEPFAPDGSASTTGELTNPVENALPENTTSVFIDDEHSFSENIEDTDDYSKEKLYLNELLDSDPWLGNSVAASISKRERLSNKKQFLFNDLSFAQDEEDINEDGVFSPATFGPEFSLEGTLQLTELNESDHFPLDFWQLLSITETFSGSIQDEKAVEHDEIKEDPGMEVDFFDQKEIELLSDFVDIIRAPYSSDFHRSLTSTNPLDYWWQNSASSLLSSPATFSYSPTTSSYPSYHRQISSSSMSDPLALPYFNSSSNVMNLVNDSVTEAVICSENMLQASEIELTNHKAVYSNQNCTDMDYITEGFLSSILIDDDLEMTFDTALNEGVLPIEIANTCRNVTHDCVERATDSDSAVSSLGPGRLSSLSDSDWIETNSDSGHILADHYVSDFSNKYYCYENFMYDAYVSAIGQNSPNRTSCRLSPSHQKKCHLFNKKSIQKQKSGHHIVHNHTYHASYDSVNAARENVHMPIFLNKMKSKSRRKSKDEQSTRDERKAREHCIPISLYDIINLPMEEFNERISRYDLSEKQLALIRDIRRRGKNKVAAQNCRKRKLDQITTLEEEVKSMRDRKSKLLQDKDFFTEKKEKLQAKCGQLFRHIYSRLCGIERREFILYEASMRQMRALSTNISTVDIDQSSNNISQTKNKDRKL